MFLSPSERSPPGECYGLRLSIGSKDSNSSLEHVQVRIETRETIVYQRLALYSAIIVNNLQSGALGLFPRGWPFPVLHRAGDDAKQLQD